jgi:hypothetical protein
MQSENSPNCSNDGRVSSQLLLLSEAEKGNLVGLLCPSCLRDAVRVWFTRPQGNLYRTWFICTNCEFYFRAQNTTAPKYFSDERRRDDLESKDISIVRGALFKR